MKKVADILSKSGKWLLVFGFVFSQVSFPLEVLAEELTNDESTYMDVTDVTEDSVINTGSESNDVQASEPIIKINGEEVDEYTISDNTDVTITLEYQDETMNKIVNIDFSKKLYGSYKYTFDSVEKSVFIDYLGNNADLLKQYVKEVESTKNIVCSEVECVISGFGNGEVKVADIIGYYDLVAFGGDYNGTVVIANGEEMLVDADVIINGYELKIVDNQASIEDEKGVLVNTTPETIYTINRVGDAFIPSDGLIDELDQETVLDDIINENDVTNLNDVNGDGVLDVLDATHSTFMESDLVEGEITDILTNSLVVNSPNEDILVGDTIEVKLFVSGFDKLSLRGIEGLLSYDKNILKLVGVSLYEDTLEELENLGELNLENGKFAYVLGSRFNNSEVALLTLQFEVLSVGESEVTISNIIESYGEAFEVENDTVSVNVTVVEEGIGGDVELPDDSTEDEEENTEQEDTNKETTTEKNEDTVVVVRPVVKSSDYYIKNLTITGYDIDFDKYTYEYKIKVNSSVNSLNLKVVLNNSKSIYYVEGNENFKEGENLVYITVKAENGSTKTYTINVEKEKEKVTKEDTKIDEDETEEETNGSTSKVVIIILIILVIIGLIYVIFKDDEEETKVEKKTSQPEKVKREEVRIEKVSSENTRTTLKKSGEVKKKTSNSKNTSSSNKTKKNNKK